MIRTAKKPWTDGLLESVIAVDFLFKHSLNQKNRLCLIILDSTVEIAYKEYLLNEKGLGIQAFKKIAENRAEVEKAVAKHITTLDLPKINYFYKLRCDLIHQRATPNVADSQIVDYRAMVEAMLEEMFGLDWTVT